MLLVVADRREQVDEVMVVQAVVRVSTLPPNPNETGSTQQSQLMRGGARGEPDRRRELLDRVLVVEHRPEESEATRGAERLHRLGKPLRLVDPERARWIVMVGRARHGDRAYMYTTAQMRRRARDRTST